MMNRDVVSHGMMALLLLCLSVLHGCDGASSSGEAADADRKDEQESDMMNKDDSTTQPVALWLGDSLLDAVNVDKDERFAGLVAAEIDGYAHDIQGRGGWSAAAYLRNWNEKVESKLPDQADRIVIQLGANDLREHGLDAGGIERYAKDMVTLIGKLRQRYPDADLVLLSPANFTMGEITPNLRDAGFGDDANYWLEQAGLRLKEVAEQQDAHFISLFGALQAGQTTDGAHPTVAGHAQLAERIIKGWPE